MEAVGFESVPNRQGWTQGEAFSTALESFRGRNQVWIVIVALRIAAESSLRSC
jgi:hypothetical protein